MPSTTVTFALDGNLSLKAFTDEVVYFRKLIDALSNEIASAAKIRWLLEGLEYGSAIATIRGEAADLAQVEKVVVAYAAVGRALERGQSPPYSQKVVRQADKMVALLNGEVKSIRFETPEEEATVVSPSEQQVAPSATLGSYGAVEGRIQTLSSRGGLRFTMYDTLRDKAVSCYLQEGQQEMMRDVWGQRARVEGWVTRNAASGRPTSIWRVRRLTLLRDITPGSYREARGILPRGPADLPPEQVIRRLRDA